MGPTHQAHLDFFILLPYVAKRDHVAPLDKFLKPMPWHETSTCCRTPEQVRQERSIGCGGGVKGMLPGQHPTAFVLIELSDEELLLSP